MSSEIGLDHIEEHELKSILHKMKSGATALGGEVGKDVLVQAMMKHIGSTDSELRDRLIYSSFYYFIIEDNQLEHELLDELLDHCLSDLLFKGIGENGTDTVFTRAFTTLLIALILGRDNEDDFLSEQTVHTVKEKLIRYMNAEKDLRGFVPEKGWAHSIAHAADAFDELAKNPKLGRKSYPDLLKPLWNKIFVSTSVYVHEEDERIITPIITMMENGLETKEVVTLLQQMPEELSIQKEQLEEENYWILVFNCKTFLKSFYIKAGSIPKLRPLQKSIEKCLAAI
ncbi:DUF2785 domain-containing protein [Bacillus marinisedimentorum]|uniref:DUF2785 domain-containing protein n=1 Tax=Bacillus marinisedimentorum TaxID=1821260 RepID=UPI0008730731|nr:DUF2785 domain-containing protein [Bacillus marinisedimentorum]